VIVTQQNGLHTTRPRAGFTLLEMLTVVIIVGLLLAIGTPSVLRMQLIAMRRTSHVRINTLETGCNAYKNDFNMYPPSGSVSGNGATTSQGQFNLVRCLVGYQDASGDGYNGLGFKTSAKGRVYGPYAGCEDVKYTQSGSAVVFLDAFDYPILYYCGMKFVNGNYVFGGYQSGDNSNGPSNINGNYVTIKNANNALVYARKDFILCSKGPDGKWPNEAKIPDDYESAQAALDQRDDITNFLDEG